MHKNNVEGVWQLGRETFVSALENGTAKLGRKNKLGQWSINYLNQGLLKEIETGSVVVVGREESGAVILERRDDKLISAKSVWNRSEHEASQYGSVLLQTIVGKRFSFPKSLYSERDTIRFAVKDKPNALIIDFFAGSGTTLHAVNLLNAEDGGHRRCICVTNNEVSADEAKKFTADGLRQGDPEWEERGIARYVTWPRTRCSIEGVDVSGKPLRGKYMGSDMPMEDGFEENAVFLDLTYQNPDAVELGAAFEEIAPLLWLRAGARGSMIEHEEQGFAIAGAYAVLFDYSYVRDFVPAVLSTPNISCAFIVTDDSSRFASVKKELGSMECVRLYESYLRSFRIAAEDAVR